MAEAATDALAEALTPLLRSHLLPLAGVGALSYAAVVLLIPRVAPRMPAKLSGKDLCKRGTPAGDIPMCVRLCRLVCGPAIRRWLTERW